MRATPALGWAGPGSAGAGSWTTAKALPKKARDGMVYGDPVIVV